MREARRLLRAIFFGLGLLLSVTTVGAQTVPELAPGALPPAGQWVKRSWLVPTWTNDCNNAGDSNSIWNVAICGSYPLAKHERMFYRRDPVTGVGEMVIAGGDHPVSMPHPGYYDGTGTEVTAVNNLTGKWRIVRPFCVPGTVQPGRSDNVPWVYDSKRDRGIMTPGYMNPPGSVLTGGCGAIENWGGYALDFPTRLWTGPDGAAGLPAPPDVGWGGDRGASFGVYSTVLDEMIRVRQEPQLRLEALNLATKTWRFLPMGNWNTQAARAQTVIDQRDQQVYWIDAWSTATQPVEGTFITGQVYLVNVDLRTGGVTRIPVPSQFKRLEGLAADLYLAFDPGNRVVLIPNSYDMGSSPLQGLGLYQVDTGQWTWESVPDEVYGSAWGFDESVGALIGIGKRSPPYATYLYRPRPSGAPRPSPAPGGSKAGRP